MFCAALIGAGLGFLWFNAPPAAVFMGDTGSLALGGALGAVAVAVKHEIVLVIVGGLFVVETVSVIVQVVWFKRTGRRVFLMAPLHHHFEKKGWSEPTIVIRFWIISMILALVGPGDAEDPMSTMTFPSTLFAGQRFAVVGLGRNGLPAAHALLAHGRRGHRLGRHRSDTRAPRRPKAHRRASPRCAALDRARAVAGHSARLAEAAPDCRGARIAAGVPILSDAELLYRAVRAAGSRARFAGITGTNGKSTTTALLAHILDGAGVPVAAGGNLGTAALALPLLPDDGVYVLEMSSYMLERIDTLRFDAAVMLNLSADHLDRHGDMAGYARAKRAIFDRQSRRRPAVIGIDDAPRARWRRGCTTRAGDRRSRVSERDQVRSASSERRAACPVRTMRRTPPPPRSWPPSSAPPRARRSRAACNPIPACRTGRSGWRRSAACCSSTTARRPTPIPPRAPSAATTG